MSKRKIVACLSLLAVVVTGATWMVVGGFPLEAAPQVQVNVVRPTVEIAGEEPLLHQPVVTYPPRARGQRIEGQVNLEVSIDENGSVYDARVLSGPEELRSAALRAVLGWHYSDTVTRPSTRVVTLDFQLPTEGEAPPQVLSDMLDKVHRTHGTVESIDIEGLPAEMRAALLAGLPIKEGEVLTHGDFQAMGNYLRTFDEHFRVGMRVSPNMGEEGSEKTVAVQIFFTPIQGQAPTVHGSQGAFVQAEASPVGEDGRPKRRIRVGGEVQASRLIHQVPPTYPPLARQARVEGTVVLLAVIGQDGTVEKLDVEEGPALLVPAALEAVKEWKYAPTLLNGEPVQVATRVDVGFHLSQ